MSEERLARFVLGGLLILFLLVRSFFTIKSRIESGRKTRDSNAIAREGKANYFIRRLVITPALSASVLLYYSRSSWISIFSIPLPLWGICVGTFLGVCGMAFLIWVHVHLGRLWSANLQVGNDHRLIRTGPYSRIRHPMYTALFTVYLSMGIVSSNYSILVLTAMVVISIAIRIPKEEEMMIEKFGEEYRTYIKNTGCLFPKLLPLQIVP